MVHKYEIDGFPVIFYTIHDVVDCLASLDSTSRHLFETSTLRIDGIERFFIRIFPDGSFTFKLIYKD